MAININLKIEKKHLYLLVASMVFLTGVGYVIATAVDPTVHGHSEIDGDVSISNGNLVIEDHAPQINLTDTDGKDYWIHVNENRLYFLFDGDENGLWETPHPLYFEGRDAFFGGDITVAGNCNGCGGGTLTCRVVRSTAWDSNGNTYAQCAPGEIAISGGCAEITINDPDLRDYAIWPSSTGAPVNFADTNEVPVAWGCDSNSEVALRQAFAVCCKII